MPNPPSIRVLYGDLVAQGKGFWLIAPSAPVAVKRVDAAVHV
jgi:hypothetical protein